MKIEDFKKNQEWIMEAFLNKRKNVIMDNGNPGILTEINYHFSCDPAKEITFVLCDSKSPNILSRNIFKVKENQE